MNYLFVDRILNLIPGQSSLGLKHITSSDYYLTHQPNDRIALVSCIMGEALGQLCSWNVIKASDFKLRLIGGIANEVLIHDNAYLGETLILENTIERLDLDNQVVNFHGIARVNERIIFEVKNGLGPLLPIADFGNVDTVAKEFNHLYRPGDIPQLQASLENPVNSELFLKPVLVEFKPDRIIAWDKGKSVIAQKNISITAPYFADHFPARPVLPITLLVETKLQLAYSFLQELVLPHLHDKIKAIAVRRLKMNDFVEPGTVIYIHMQLKDRTDDHFILSFRTEVDGKRICVCEAEFEVANIETPTT